MGNRKGQMGSSILRHKVLGQCGMKRNIPDRMIVVGRDILTCKRNHRNKWTGTQKNREVRGVEGLLNN